MQTFKGSKHTVDFQKHNFDRGCFAYSQIFSAWKLKSLFTVPLNFCP